MWRNFYLYTVVLVRKRKDWLARNQDNVSKCGEMFYLHTVVLVSKCGEMFYMYTVVLVRKRKDWMAINQDNVSKCGEMCCFSVQVW